jgi:hypothetical protein
MGRFTNDLTDFIESASTVDLMTTLGILGSALEPRASQDIVYDAMKLDVSARNKTPASCSIWIGARMLPIAVTMENLAFPTMTEIYAKSKSIDSSISVKERRMLAELSTVFKYPLVCEKRTNDMYFANESSTASLGHISDTETLALDYADRRLIRVEQLLQSWGAMMMNEWATSLYSSRQARYISRSTIAKQCLSVYYSQVVSY